MQNEVIKIGNASFLSQTDKTIIKRILNSDFEINDDFSGNRSKLSFDSLSASILSEEGAIVTSNTTSTTVIPVKIYLAKYRKGSCDWNDVIYYRVLEDATNVVTLNQWDFLYANSQYCVYRIFSRDFPTTLPLNGNLPPVDRASFIKYESFRNVWLRRQCQFKYETSIVSLEDIAGNDTWKLESSNAEECFFSYTKSTPFGCNFDIPSTENINITSDCECIQESSSSSVSSSSSSTQIQSSESSRSSESSFTSGSSSLNSSSSEARMSTKNIANIYLRLVGEPFVAAHYILKLQDANVVPLVWSATKHASDTATTGTITLTMNSSGRFILSTDVKVNGSTVIIENALLSNIRNDNFSSYSSYLKGLATVCSQYITTKYTDGNGEQVFSYDCIISYESMKRNNGAPKNLSEIIYDYEMAELSVDDESDKVNLYFGKANISGESSSNDQCRAWGFFSLNNVDDGVWEYSNDEQSIRLSRTDGGCWTLYRQYMNSVTDIQEIEMEIDSKTITSNISGEYGGFGGTCIVPRYGIRGGVEIVSAADVCNDKDTVIAFYSADSSLQNSNYNPFSGNLALTISGGGWNGKTSYVLVPNIISSNLTVWNWSNGSSVDNFEYAVFFSHDGILWKLMLYKKISSSISYFFAEFIKENQNADNFSPVFQKIHKSCISLNGDWGSEDAMITVTGVK